VSLILDALRKLERDKDSREPGVLVVGSVPWGEKRASYRPLALLSVALAALALAGWWWWRPTPRPSAPVAASPTVAAPPSPAPGRAAASPPPQSPAPGSSAPVPAARHLEVPTAGEEPPPAAPADEPAAAPASRSGPDALRLNAIARRDGRPVALINDRLVFEGDSFDGVKILRIGEAEVEVEVRGQRRVLRF
jgi:hypothetical protein